MTQTPGSKWPPVPQTTQPQQGAARPGAAQTAQPWPPPGQMPPVPGQLPRAPGSMPMGQMPAMPGQMPAMPGQVPAGQMGWGVQAPGQQPAAQPPAGEAFAFAATPSDEKYNTKYLTTQLVSERRRSRIIVASVIVAMVLGLMLWFSFSPKKEEPVAGAAPEKGAPAAVAASAPAAAAPTAPAATTPATAAPAAAPAPGTTPTGAAATPAGTAAPANAPGAK